MSTPGLKPTPPCTFVIFGAAGDLTKRKLLPALYNLKAASLLPRQFAIVGVARKQKSHEQFREEQSKDIREFATQKVDEALWNELRSGLFYESGEFTDPATYTKLKALLEEVARSQHTMGNVLFYLATPPEFFAEIVKRLGEAGLVASGEGAWRRVVIEKPFGRDLDSARALNAELGRVLEERQIYRIDHYLGKETVQNNMVQLLALVAMEPPTSFQADAVRDERVKVLKAIRTWKPEDVLARAVRGQYGPGEIDGQPVPGYRGEPKVNPQSNTETYAALRIQVENWRWAGVPFYLRSGKWLPRRDTEIMIQFRRPPLLLFDQSEEQIEPNRMVLHIQPDEGIEIRVKAKHPGPAMELNTVKLDFSYRQFGETNAATGYERLLYDSMVGDSTLFHRADMVEEAWRIATPAVDVWASLPARDFPNYAAGAWGPLTADALIQRDGRQWWLPH